jgi:tetratricopeptide (TPR) repeat protein
MNVFLSCVSTEFKSYRLRLANQLGALKDHPYDIKVQEDFQQGGFTLLDKLADYVRECNVVIHLAGDACGARPFAEHVQALYRSLGEALPEPLPDHSYTQWEYHLAQRFRRKMLVYIAAPDTSCDCALPVQQSDDAARLQQAHIAAIKQSGKHHGTFSGYNSLVREVFHDLGLEPERKCNNLPYKSLGSLFKGRDQFLGQMHDALGRVEHRGHQRFAAITASATSATVHGLGGIGKTRTVIEYAHRYAQEYTALLFVRADTPGGLQQNLTTLCGPAVLDLPERDAREVDVQVAAVVHWLQQHPGWLLILDNADTEDAAQAVQDLLGKLTPSGQVLVTSRLSNWPGALASLPLDVLDETDAAAFLLDRTDSRRRKAPDDTAQAHTLAAELGCLALALEQVGAYIERYRCSFVDYFAEWQQRRDAVLQWFDPRVIQYPASVAVTWQTSFDGLTEPARKLLRILAWLAPDPIPESLLETGGVPLPVADKRSVGVAHEAREALADLEAQSLITRSDEAATFTLHRLVQDVTRRSLREKGATIYLEWALRWISDAFVEDPEDVRTWPVLVPLASHALAVTGHADAAQINEPTTRLMNQLGLLYEARSQYSEAESLYRRALIIDEKVHGSDHPFISVRLNNLARLLSATNRLNEAEPLYRHALAIDANSPGLQSRIFATHLTNLAALLQATNRLAEAELLCRRALTIRQKACGLNHPDVANSLNNLAELLKSANRLTEAEPLLRRALAINENYYGPENPNVASNLANLAASLQRSSRLTEAEPLMRRALAINEKSYGPEHSKVATDLTNLAQLLHATNRLAEAEPLMRRALAVNEKSYGSEHPKIATSLNNLSLLLQDTDRLAEAEPLIRRALTIDQQSYGPDHPDVARDVNNLALLLKKTGRFDQAEPLYRRALAIDQQSYGPDHPYVANDLGNLGRLLEDTNRLREAEPLMRRALEILLQFRRDTGHEHPHLNYALRNYASLLQEMGYFQKQVLARLRDLAAKYGVSLSE